MAGSLIAATVISRLLPCAEGGSRIEAGQRKNTVPSSSR